MKRVQKFRSIEEMGGAPIDSRAGDGFERFVRHCARLRGIAGPQHLRGVFKFRTIDEAQAARERRASKA